MPHYAFQDIPSNLERTNFCNYKYVISLLIHNILFPAAEGYIHANSAQEMSIIREYYTGTPRVITVYIQANSPLLR